VVAADQAAGNGYDAAPQVRQVFDIVSPVQVVLFTSIPPIPPIKGGTYSVTATGGASGNPVIFASATPSTCSVSGATVTFLNIGTCTITANQAGSGGFLPAGQVVQTMAVYTTQTISFTSTPPSAALPGTSYKVSATGGGSKNPVIITTRTSSICSIQGGTVQLIAGGTCVVAANQAAGGYYLQAPEATQTFTVLMLQVIQITSTPPKSAVRGDTYDITATGGGSGNPVKFGSLTASICGVSGHVVTMVGSGNCVVTANQTGNSTYAPAAEVQQKFRVK
jgi:hypothetical protein